MHLIRLGSIEANTESFEMLSLCLKNWQKITDRKIHGDFLLNTENQHDQSKFNWRTTINQLNILQIRFLSLPRPLPRYLFIFLMFHQHSCWNIIAFLNCDSILVKAKVIGEVAAVGEDYKEVNFIRFNNFLPGGDRQQQKFIRNHFYYTPWITATKYRKL